MKTHVPLMITEQDLLQQQDRRSEAKGEYAMFDEVEVLRINTIIT